MHLGGGRSAVKMGACRSPLPYAVAAECWARIPVVRAEANGHACLLDATTERTRTLAPWSREASTTFIIARREIRKINVTSPSSVRGEIERFESLHLFDLVQQATLLS